MTDSRERFRNSGTGLYTKSLIYECETQIKHMDRVIYTLKRDDIEVHGKKLISLPRVYLETADPSEYIFANKYFYDFRHWQAMLKMPAYGWAGRPFIEHVEEWREELGHKLKSDAIQRVLQLSKKDSGLSAAKWIVEGNLSKIDKPVAGKRVTKKDKEVTPKADKGDLEMLKGLDVNQ